MTATLADRRFKRGRRCPICGGSDTDERGQEKRCHGFVSKDSEFIHCSREELAGGIRMSPGSETFAHRREGKCACGTTHNEPAEPRQAAQHAPRIVATYGYRDENGELLYQVVRKDPKAFLQRRHDGRGGWIWKLDEVDPTTGNVTHQTRRVLYRMPELLAAEPGEPVYIVEGEKDVDALRALGVEATCNSEGSGKWSRVDERARRALAGRHVVIVADKDGPGRTHAAQVAMDLVGYAASVRRLEMPGDNVKDAYDWIAAGGNGEQLEALRLAAPLGVDIGGGDTVGRGKTNGNGHHAPTTGDAPQVVFQSPDYAAVTGEAEPDPFETEIAKALAEIQSALGNKGRKNRKPLFSVDAAELLGEEFPETPWLITGLLPVGGVAMVGGGPKEAKKTWKATEMAIAVATGTKAFGEFYAEQGSARYFYAEDMRRQIRNRIRALLAGADRTIAKDALLLCPRGEFIDVLQDEELAWILASCRHGPKPALVVLDPLSDIHSGEEDKRDSMREVMRRLRLLAELVGCTVIAVHHVVKPNESTKGRSGGQRLRGSSAIHGSLDCGIYVLECEGDGVSTFKNTVQSEVKGARSAGKFVLELCIEDDAGGEAVRATWKYSEDKPDDTKKTKGSELDDKVFEFVRTLAMRGEVMSRRKLREHDEAPYADKVMRSSLDRLIDENRLYLDRADVRIPSPTGREDQ